MRPRIVDNEISQAWLEAANDLQIRVVAPFDLRGADGNVVKYEAHILDFGGPRGVVVGVVGDDLNDARKIQGYYASNLAPVYRHYERQHFIDTLNDWQWFGDQESQPDWYTGKPWS